MTSKALLQAESEDPRRICAASAVAEPTWPFSHVQRKNKKLACDVMWLEAVTMVDHIKILWGPPA